MNTRQYLEQVQDSDRKIQNKIQEEYRLRLLATSISSFSSMPADKSEDVMKEVKTFVDGISEANKAALDNAKSEWEKSVLDDTPNPGGGNSDKEQKKDDNDSPAAKYVKAYSARMNPKTEPADDNAPVNF